MARGDLGHSRKVDLAGVLALIAGQRAARLIDEVADMYGVGYRSARQALADLVWGRYVDRKSTETIELTDLGRLALRDSSVAAGLISLPKRHRLHRSALRDDG